MAAFHRTFLFCATFQSSGSEAPSAMPSASIPRNCGQSIPGLGEGDTERRVEAVVTNSIAVNKQRARMAVRLRKTHHTTPRYPENSCRDVNCRARRAFHGSAFHGSG